MSTRKDILKPFELKRDYMEDRIRSGIESGRKAFAFLRFTDEKGAGVNVKHVEVRQKTHEFKYGANIFMLDEFDTAEDNAQYRKKFAEAFNIATVPFYWKDLEPEQGKPRYAKDSPKVYRRPSPDLCVEYCLEHGIEPKAHCLNYEYFTPSWCPADDIAREKLLLEKRFRELAERYSADIPAWEVTNETFWGLNRGKLALYDSPDFVEWSFKLAEKYFPANKLIINEYSDVFTRLFCGYRSTYFMQIERALLKGARIDAIGMQYHMFFRKDDEQKCTAPFYDPEQIYNVLDTYGSLNLPLQITEMTIPAYSTLAEDEETQSAILYNLMRMFFSHPCMDAVIYWNLIDGYTYGKKGDMTDGENVYRGGLLDSDFREKPAFKMIKELFGKTFRTNLSLEAGDSDSVSFKGFCGDYELEITTADDQTVNRKMTLSKHFSNTVKVVI